MPRPVDPVEELLLDWGRYRRVFVEAQGTLQRTAKDLMDLCSGDFNRQAPMPGVYANPVLANLIAEEGLRIGFVSAVDLRFMEYPFAMKMLMVGRYVGQLVRGDRPHWKTYTWAEIELELGMNPVERKGLQALMRKQVRLDAVSTAKLLSSAGLQKARDEHDLSLGRMVLGDCTQVPISAS